jgi:hypothetical protein
MRGLSFALPFFRNHIQVSPESQIRGKLVQLMRGHRPRGFVALASVGLLAGFGFMTGAQAQQKDRDALVRKDRSVMEDSAMWIYNDVEKGFRISQKNGKPLLIVFR